MNKLYHYVHCPYCIRVRMALGFLGIKAQEIVVPYEDEQTPTKLTGVKMLPILQKEDGSAMNESLDIIGFLDRDHRLAPIPVGADDELENWLSQLGSSVHNLAMPYWVWTPEFSADSRAYFEAKKSKKRGPFKDLVKKRHEFEDRLIKDLGEFETHLKPWFKSSTFGLADIMVAAHLWGMFVVPEFRFSDKMHSYLMGVKEQTKFDYHSPFWAN